MIQLQQSEFLFEGFIADEASHAAVGIKQDLACDEWLWEIRLTQDNSENNGRLDLCIQCAKTTIQVDGPLGERT